jgi:peroxiredoxin
VAAQSSPVEIIGIAWSGDQASYQEFVDRHGLTFRNLADDNGDLFARFEVPYQPAWAFVSPTGDVMTEQGVLSEAELEERLAAITS